MSIQKWLAGIATIAAFASTGFACDKRPPDDEAPAESDETTEAPSGTTSSEESESAPTSNADARAGRWKANDVHTHIDSYAYPILEKVLSENDVHRVVNLSGGRSADSWAKHRKRVDSLETRVAQFFRVDWSRLDEPDFGEKMADQLERAVREYDYAGVKISKALGLQIETEDGELLPVDTPKLDPLWERAGELGVPVTIHTADPTAFFREPGPDNERWEELKAAPDWSFHGEEYPSKKSLLEARDRMVARHPDTTFILAHMANNPEKMEYVSELLSEHDNLYVDTSARIAEFGRHPAPRIREFFIEFQDRILFGTDLGLQAKPSPKGLYYSLFLGSIRKDRPTLEDVKPFFDKHWRYFESDTEAIPHPIPIQGDWKVHPIDLPRRVLAKIYWRNTERVVFAPWLGRSRAHHVADRAASRLE